jgi:soluble lytic murein transglycosylase
MEGFVVADGGRVVKSGLLAFGALIWAAPLCAQAAPDPLAPLPVPAPAPQEPAAVPAQNLGTVEQPITQQLQSVPALTPSEPPARAFYVPRDWRGVFDAIDAGEWSSARAGIAALPRGALTPVAKAELYIARGSPVVDLASIEAVLAEAPELPEANQLAALAVRRGVLAPPPIAPEKPVYNIGSAPFRYKAHPVQGEPYADQLRTLLDPLIKTDNAAGAEAQLLVYAPQLSYEARAEAAQRVAFAYYVNGLDTDARRVADTWRPAATGEWASQAAWVSALASWRLGDWNAA